MKAILQRFLLSAGIALVLAAAFLAYLRPGFIMDLGNRLFVCF